MRLTQYIIRRLLLLIPVLIGVTIVTFTISHVVPADPVRAYCGQKCDANTVANLRAQLGLDQPLWLQYVNYVGGLLHGDLGFSLVNNGPVLAALQEYFPATFELSVFALAIAIPGGILLGIVSAVYRERLPDHVTRFGAVLLVSVPAFWLALMLQYLFAFQLGWLPLSGRLDPGVTIQGPTGLMLIDAWLVPAPAGYSNLDIFVMAFRHLILPGVTLAALNMGYLTRIMRSSMLEAGSEDYVRTARAKGVPKRRIVFSHTARNALIPAITVAGVLFALTLGGAVLTESIYSWPGMGQFSADAVINLDFAAVLGYTFVTAVIVVLANLVVDILYAAVDPRVRLG
ncbi:MAG: ABC transporter permease [Thermoplasmatota archaeon]